ncbi:PIF1-like helicase-domain-containing protein [Russula brevipes]|nr:PIF1-like helicase-domain-containing protein [Russula brevipes]KAI0290000.1 PIF1-like helicase-domain-containing protein [Russula brevipes]
MLKHCEPTDPGALWNEYAPSLCDDLQRILERKGLLHPSLETTCDFGLFLLDELLHDMGCSILNFPSMPRITHAWHTVHDNPYISEHMSYNRNEERILAENNRTKLNVDQSFAYDQILSSFHHRQSSLFFIDGPGGTGKTFLYNTLCHQIRADGGIAICVASSGIASLLLPGGRTAHSTFAIPVQNLCEDTCCQIDKRSTQADFLRIVDLIIWDEAVMQHK